MLKFFKTLFCVLFALIIIIPLVSMPFFGEESAEKRDLADKPMLKTEEGKLNTEFFADTDTYLSERFGFRSMLVTSLSTLKDAVFKTSAEDDVVIGEDGWLFFAKTLNDYTGENSLSKEDISRIAKTVDLINEYTVSKGAKFAFFIAPNKNTVYPDKMPYYYLKSDKSSNLDMLSKALKDKDYYLNLLPLFEKEERQIYHSLDSHWNNLGAAIGFDAFMNKLGIEHTDYLSLDYDIKNTHKGDLDGMLYPSSDRMDEQVVFDYEPSFEYKSRFKTEEDITIKTTNADKSGSLTIYRDSFCNALLPMLADEFKTVEFSRIFPYRLNLVEKNKSDAVIIELVERNISNLLLSAPVMQAPLRNDVKVTETNFEISGTKKSGGLMQIYGTVEARDKDIYIVVKQGETKTVYEAFPIYESELIDGTKEVKSGGFSAFLPISDVDGLDIKICIG